MPEMVLLLDPRDNVLVALTALEAGTVAEYGPSSSRAQITVTQSIPVKHKLALVDLKPGDLIYLFGMIVGETVEAIPRGGVISTRNIRHRTAAYSAERKPAALHVPDASAWRGRSFMGYHRADGQVERATTGSWCRWCSARTATWSG